MQPVLRVYCMTSCVLLPAAQHQPPSLSLDVDWVLSCLAATQCVGEDGLHIYFWFGGWRWRCPSDSAGPSPRRLYNMYAPHQLVQFPFGPGHLYQPQAMLTAWPHHVLVQSVTEAALEPDKSTTPAGHWQLSSRTQQQATSGGPCQSSCSEAGVVPAAQQEASGRQLPSAPHANQEPAWLPRAAPLSLPAQPLSSSAAARSNHVQQPTAKLLQARSKALQRYRLKKASRLYTKKIR
ncbi:hypothetical protein QJQ45_022345 [Haematococcus lacustris]|nr:hypothetical protein QJQ45_022345 [Haematococcus lacustris]